MFSVTFGGIRFHVCVSNSPALQLLLEVEVGSFPASLGNSGPLGSTIQGFQI